MEEIWVVKLDENTEKYLVVEGETHGECEWGDAYEAIEYTQAEAEEVAGKINSGSLGVPRPQN